ncbi:MAG: hypothetical protein IJI73_08510, partial [Kiritimatiellae bacterium]|nr:hypothetical protein [Kiritimatiellia bacterium]
KKLLAAGLVCAAACTTALAAPHGGKHAPAPRPAPAHHQMRAPTHDPHRAAPAPAAHHHRHHAHARPAPPPPPPPPPRTVVVHHESHEVGLATAIGALVGGLIGAAL